MINRKELIKKYIEFFKSKGHAKIANSSLVPENDPTVLFTTAGMQPLVPYLLGQPHPQGGKVCNVQKCIRTGDIEEVGDTTHHTCFEMLGNWSIGDYFKKEAIEWSFEFLTKVLEIPLERLAFTVFEGNENAPRDEEAADIWKSLGVSEKRIAYLNKDENWWGPAGETGPCGPDSEMFYWKDNNEPAPEVYDPEDPRWVEIWNDVFMQYVKDSDGNYNLAEQKNVDTGMGVERVVAILNGFEDNYESSIYQPIIKKIEGLSNQKYDSDKNKKAMRIIADHIKASCFIIADGVTPSNTDQGYVLRRLIRRAIRYGKKLGLENFVTKVAEPVFEVYNDYEHLIKSKEKILNKLKLEEERFNLTLEKGLNKFNKITEDINGKTAFLLFQSFGFPLEMTIELAQEKGLKVDEQGFKEEFEKHQELSRTAAEGKFKSGLADNSEQTTKLHTATHLLLRALQIVLKDDAIIQRGSNINPERIRFDFSFDRKLTKEELQEIEDLVNAQIQSSCEVVREEMSPEEAKAQGACGIFDTKYGDKVSVYTIGDFSKEICTGPHVKNTCEIGHFKIKKETSSSSGVRRIKAIIE